MHVLATHGVAQSARAEPVPPSPPPNNAGYDIGRVPKKTGVCFVWKQVILKEAVSVWRGGSSEWLNTRLGAVIIYYGIVWGQLCGGVLGRAVPCLTFKTSLIPFLPHYRGIRSLH